jgi:hypothetical protein
MANMEQRPVPSSEDLIGRVEKLEEGGPIDISTVDFTMRNKEEVARQLGKPLAYIDSTESQVPLRYVPDLGTFLPHAEDYVGRFITEWGIEEGIHGDITDKTLGEINYPRPVLDPGDSSHFIKIGGAINNRVPAFHQMSLVAYLVEGAMQERLTMQGYHLLVPKLKDLAGEEIVRTGFQKIQKQEPGHYNFYKDAARYEASKLPKWQRYVVWAAIAKTWDPVGANTAQQKQDFAVVARTLLSEDSLDTGTNNTLPVLDQGKLLKFTKPIQEVGDNLMGVDELSSTRWGRIIMRLVGDKHADTPHPPAFVLSRIMEEQRELDRQYDLQLAA